MRKSQAWSQSLDVVGPEPLQALLARADKILAVAPAPVRIPPDAGVRILRSEDEPVPAALEEPAEEGLAGPVYVAVRRVDEVAARVLKASYVYNGVAEAGAYRSVSNRNAPIARAEVVIAPSSAAVKDMPGAPPQG